MKAAGQCHAVGTQPNRTTQVVRTSLRSRRRWFYRNCVPGVAFTLAAVGILLLWPAAEPACRAPMAGIVSASTQLDLATNLATELSVTAPVAPDES